jgi:hypothetical protein
MRRHERVFVRFCASQIVSLVASAALCGSAAAKSTLPAGFSSEALKAIDQCGKEARNHDGKLPPIALPEFMPLHNDLVTGGLIVGPVYSGDQATHYHFEDNSWTLLCNAPPAPPEGTTISGPSLLYQTCLQTKIFLDCLQLKHRWKRSVEDFKIETIPPK